MKIVLMLALIITLPSCGKRNSSTSECRNREYMRMTCTTQHTPNYGYGYAVDMCNRTYTVERCY